MTELEGKNSLLGTDLVYKTDQLKIAVAIDKESSTDKDIEYFMPCALSYAPEASVSESSPPWVIRLRVRRGDKDDYIPIPVGYLPAVQVRTQQCSLPTSNNHFTTQKYEI